MWKDHRTDTGRYDRAGVPGREWNRETTPETGHTEQEKYHCAEGTSQGRPLQFDQTRPNIVHILDHLNARQIRGPAAERPPPSHDPPDWKDAADSDRKKPRQLSEGNDSQLITAERMTLSRFGRFRSVPTRQQGEIGQSMCRKNNVVSSSPFPRSLLTAASPCPRYQNHTRNYRNRGTNSVAAQPPPSLLPAVS